MPPRPRRQGWPSPRLWRLLGWVALCLSLTVAGQNWAEWDFPHIIGKAEQRYGGLGSARERMEAWARLLQTSGDKPELEKLALVNSFFNRQMAFKDDMTVWHVEDYWATPLEALWKGAGDCEDYAIAKYFSLRRLGVSADKLRITYVKALELNQAHMVLTYYPDADGEPLVLDSLLDTIEPADARKDLLPVYAFNGEGVWLPDATDSTIGSNSMAGDIKQLSRWQDVLNKMKAEGFPVEGNTP